ncbi:hypothetical protein VNO77_04090 [Canavalia gladiata]|uniref:Uncharacterized protein n=1 Tax=Canavalia gladiata TaxID=3824 RepID=A0AAN9N122_CANGL
MVPLRFEGSDAEFEQGASTTASILSNMSWSFMIDPSPMGSLAYRSLHLHWRCLRLSNFVWAFQRLGDYLSGYNQRMSTLPSPCDPEAESLQAYYVEIFFGT